MMKREHEADDLFSMMKIILKRRA